MTKRIFISFFLAFIVLPIITPFLLFTTGIVFGYNIIAVTSWSSWYSFFYIYWASVLVHYSIFIFIFIFGFYNLIIVSYFKIKKKSITFFFKVLVFFIILSILFFVSRQEFFFNMGYEYYYLKLSLLFIFTSIIMVYLHYRLIDKKEERINGKENISQS